MSNIFVENCQVFFVKLKCCQLVDSITGEGVEGLGVGKGF